MSHRVPQSAARASLFVAGASLYVWTSAPGAFWLDSGELAAAAVTLGVPHPPGHPLYVVLGYAASLLPVGSLAFRVSLLSALTAALALVFLYDVALLACRARTGRSAGRSEEVAAWCVAATFGLADALWLQAVRPEVYTLHLALSLWVTRLALMWMMAPGPRSHTTPLLVAFIVGLGAGNHHYLLLFQMPALLLLLVAGWDRPGRLWRHLPMMCVAGALGLLVYGVLPLRSPHASLINYGDPDSWSRFLDVVTASVFQASVVETSAPLGANLMEALGMYLEALGPVVLLAVPVGFICLARARPWIAIALGLVVVGNLFTKVLMVLDPTNPDAAGYFQTGMAHAAALSVPALSLGASAASPLWRRWALPGLAACGLVGALALQVSAGPRGDLRALDGPAAVDAMAMGSVLPDAVVMTDHYALHFNRLYQQVVEGVRTDTITLHQGLDGHVEGGAPYAARMMRRDGRLAPLFHGAGEASEFPVQAALELAATRPIYMEPSLGSPIPVSRRQLEGPWSRVAPPSADGGATAEEGPGLGLTQPLVDALRGQPEGRKTMMLWYLKLAVMSLQAGEDSRAKEALDAVDAISPGSSYVARLRPWVVALEGEEARANPAYRARLRAQIAGTDFRSLFSPQ